MVAGIALGTVVFVTLIDTEQNGKIPSKQMTCQFGLSAQLL